MFVKRFIGQTLRSGFVEHLSRTLVAQQSVTKIISLIFIILVTLKARAKHELLFNKLASGVKQSNFARLRALENFVDNYKTVQLTKNYSNFFVSRTHFFIYFSQQTDRSRIWRLESFWRWSNALTNVNFGVGHNLGSLESLNVA